MLGYVNAIAVVAEVAKYVQRCFVCLGRLSVCPREWMMLLGKSAVKFVF